MRAFLRNGCALLITAAAITPTIAAAQTPIDVRTIVTVAPKEEAPEPTAPRSSFDYAAPRTPAPPQPAVPPWNVPQTPWAASPGALAAADRANGTTPSVPTGAFTGDAAPLPCRRGAYQAIVDERTALGVGTLCTLPDGTWRLLP